MANTKLSMLTPTNMAAFRDINKIYSAHYPEFMAKAFLVHAPTVMNAIWDVLKVSTILATALPH